MVTGLRAHRARTDMLPLHVPPFISSGKHTQGRGTAGAANGCDGSQVRPGQRAPQEISGSLGTHSSAEPGAERGLARSPRAPIRRTEGSSSPTPRDRGPRDACGAEGRGSLHQLLGRCPPQVQPPDPVPGPRPSAGGRQRARMGLSLLSSHGLAQPPGSADPAQQGRGIDTGAMDPQPGSGLASHLRGTDERLQAADRTETWALW